MRRHLIVTGAEGQQLCRLSHQRRTLRQLDKQVSLVSTRLVEELKGQQPSKPTKDETVEAAAHRFE